MPDAITLSELERRNRASVRARAIWDGAVAMYSAHTSFDPFPDCLAAAEREFDALLQRCVDAEPPTDPKEFGFACMPEDG